MTPPPAPLDVVYVRADGTTAVATRWSRAPKIRGLGFEQDGEVVVLPQLTYSA